MPFLGVPRTEYRCIVLPCVPTIRVASPQTNRDTSAGLSRGKYAPLIALNGTTPKPESRMNTGYASKQHQKKATILRTPIYTYMHQHLTEPLRGRFLDY